MKHFTLVDLTLDHHWLNPYLSTTLINEVEVSLKNGKKSLLYLNQRGTYKLMICQDCHHIIGCPRCDVSLSIHQNDALLKCHQCMYQVEIPLTCEKCWWNHLKPIGTGTQHIESTLKSLFPNAKIYRMDSDSVKNISEKKQAIENLQNAQIIIGTKMITTGFDFSHIGVIGVILLEWELQIPKYDTQEKIFQNFKQLSGRGGRVWQSTHIIVQTYGSKNSSITSLVESNYREFFKKTLSERKIFWYPPFCELVTLQYRNKSKEISLKKINDLYQSLLAYSPENIDLILVDDATKKNNQYFTKIILKWKQVREFLGQFKKEIYQTKNLIVIFET